MYTSFQFQYVTHNINSFNETNETSWNENESYDNISTEILIGVIIVALLCITARIYNYNRSLRNNITMHHNNFS